MAEYKAISADSHLEVKPERWTKRIPEKYQDRAPRTIRLPDGGDAFMIEGIPLREVVFLDNRAGRSEEDWKPFGLDYDEAAGSGTPERRCQEMDIDGIGAEVLYPAQFGPGFWRNIKHDEVYREVVRAYNDWLAEEYCSYNPQRLIGLGVIPATNVIDAIEEMDHCAKLGLKGVVLLNFPNGKSYPTPEDDRFWAAAVDLDVVVSAHLAIGQVSGPSDPVFKYPREDPRVMANLKRGFVEWVANFGWTPALGITKLTLSGAFERFPKLKVFFAETHIGWIPFWLESADLWYQRHLHWAKEYLGFEPLKRLPSEYVTEQCYWTVQQERIGLELRHHLHTGHIMFATDFPHIECEWPNTRAALERDFADLSEGEKRLIWIDNAVNYFKLELEQPQTDWTSVTAKAG